jgi:hypothetical protein
MKAKTLYTIRELVHVDIDAWVDAMGNLSSLYGNEVEDYDPSKDCPAEFEAEFYAVAERHKVMFTKNGEIFIRQD